MSDSTTPLAGLHVLFVDDNPDGRELFKTVLVHEGATVTSCASATEALEIFRHVIPDVLVTDIAMPHENGCWLLEEIRKLPADRGGRISALAITAYGAVFDRAQALEAGFDEYVAKPVDPWDLSRIIATSAGRTRGTSPEVGRTSA